MATTPDEVIEQLREILAANAAGNTRLATNLSEFVRDVTREASSGRRVDAADLLSRWIEFNVQSFSLLNTQSLTLLDGLLSVARQTLLPSAETAPPIQEQRVELRMSGQLGERVTTSFVLENQFDQSLDVGFESDDLTTPNGQTQPASLVDFNPPKLSIPPRNQAVGQVGVTLKGDFVVGATYRTTIRLLGFPTKEFGLQVSVLPSPEQPTSAPTRSARRRSKSSA